MFRILQFSIPFFLGVFGLAAVFPSVFTEVLVNAFGAPDPKKNNSGQLMHV